jgi:hypothetical protein
VRSSLGRSSLIERSVLVFFSCPKQLQMSGCFRGMSLMYLIENLQNLGQQDFGPADCTTDRSKEVVFPSLSRVRKTRSN